MRPKTFCGWYNKWVRGHPYNRKTAYILDRSFKPSKRLLSTLEDRARRTGGPASGSEEKPRLASFS